MFIKNTEQLLRHSCCAFASFFSVNLNLDSLLAKLSPSSTSPASDYSLTLLGRGEEKAGAWKGCSSDEKPKSGPGCSCDAPKLLPPAPSHELLALHHENTHRFIHTPTGHQTSQQPGNQWCSKQAHLLYTAGGKNSQNLTKFNKIASCLVQFTWIKCCQRIRLTRLMSSKT